MTLFIWAPQEKGDTQYSLFLRAVHFLNNWVFSDRALDSATTKVSKILKLLKKKKSSANFEIQLLQNVKTHDDGFCMKHAPLALPYLLHVRTHGLNR